MQLFGDFLKKNNKKKRERNCLKVCNVHITWIMKIRQKLSEENLDSFDCFNKENKASLLSFFLSYS